MSIQTKHSSVKYMLIEISLKIVIISLFSINSQCLIYRHVFYWLILNTEDFLIKNYDGKKLYILNIQESQTCTISISIHLFLLHGNWRVLRRKTRLLYSITNMYKSVIFLLFLLKQWSFAWTVQIALNISFTNSDTLRAKCEWSRKVNLIITLWRKKKQKFSRVFAFITSLI